MDGERLPIIRRCVLLHGMKEERFLTSTLNIALQSGCYSVLGLDQSTAGFAGATTSRYALFGGAARVAFTQISQAQTATINPPTNSNNRFFRC